jgi:tetratricopeptide (TPR) repeat protein
VTDVSSWEREPDPRLVAHVASTLQSEVDALAAGSGRPSDVWDALDDLGRMIPATRGANDDVIEALTKTVAELRQIAMYDKAAVRMLAVALDMLAGMHRMALRPELALPLAEEHLTIRRSQLAEDPGPHQCSWCARALSEFGRTMGLLKRHHEALAAFREAVALARVARDAGLPAAHLADYLSFLSQCLSALDRQEEALAAAEERVELEAQLRLADPLGNPARLAEALYSLCRRLAALGRWRAAAATAQEVVALERQLAADGSVSVQYELADALNQLGYCAENAEQWPDAEAASREEVVLRRGLPVRDATSDAVDLASALKDLAWRLWLRRGRSPEAAPLAWEAAERFRALAGAGRLEPGDMWGFAITLALIQEQLEAAGRYRDALAALQEGVGLYRQLAAVRPERHLPYLAGALADMARLLAATGDDTQAHAAYLEACSIRQQVQEPQ